MSFVERDLQLLYSIINNLGYCMFLVGGCVRDRVMGKEPSDYDILTTAPYSKLKEILKECRPSDTVNITVIVTAKSERFSTLKVLINGNAYDIKALGCQGLDSIYNDLRERDFTINSIACCYPSGEYIDVVNGLSDINNRVLRCDGKALLKFNADPLRILRAYRFAYMFKLTMTTEIKEAIKLKCSLLCGVSAERLREELLKIIVLADSPNIFRDMYYDGVLSIILPELADCFHCVQNNPHHLYNVGEHSLRTLEYLLTKTDNTNLLFAGLLHDIGKVSTRETIYGVDHFYSHAKSGSLTASFVVERFRFSKRVEDYIVDLVYLHDTEIKSVKQALTLLRKYGKVLMYDYLLLREADIMAQSEYNRVEKLEVLERSRQYINTAWKIVNEPTVKDLVINGADLINIGYIEGKQIGDCLRYLLNLVKQGKLINSRECLITAAMRYKEEICYGKKA